MNRRRFVVVGSCAGTLLVASRPSWALGTIPSGIASPVLTRGNDNDRSYYYPDKTFTVASLKTKGLRKYFNLPMEGDARGAEGQLLVLPSVVQPDGTIRDIVIQCSMNNLIYCFDWNTSDILWTVKLGIPIKGSSQIDMHNINDHWGILSTPVIDSETKLMYVVCWTSVDGTPNSGQHFIHVIDLVTGQRVKHCPLANVTYQAQKWSTTLRKQRASLSLVTINGAKTVFFAAGTVYETINGSAGWILGYDVASNTVSGFATSQGYGAGVWMGGSGISHDDNGDLLFVTGNGSFDPDHGDYGECVCRLRYYPPVNGGSASWKMIDWWSPFSDAGRVGEDPTKSMPAAATVAMMTTKISGVNKPTSAAHMAMYPDKPVAADAAFSDEDLGSTGLTIIRRYRAILVTGKDGIAYVVDMDNMGKTMPADFANPAANYAKLKAPPIWYSYFPGYNVSPAPVDFTKMDFPGKTRHIHSTSPQYYSAVHGQMVVCWGENSQCRAWTMNPDGTLTFLADSDEVASINCTNASGGMPGGFMAISSNGQQSGTALLWALIPYGDGNASITQGRLLVYDLENFTVRQDGTKKLQVLWDSQQYNYQFPFPKFNVPVVSGGRFGVPRYDGTADSLS